MKTVYTDWDSPYKDTGMTLREYVKDRYKKGWSIRTIAEVVDKTYDQVQKIVRYVPSECSNVVDTSGVAPSIIEQINDFDEEDALKKLLAKGYELHKHVAPTNKEVVVDTSIFDGDVFRVGLISDTHLNSKYCQMTTLRNAYKKFEDEGIKLVLHAGDISAGQHMYRGQEYELVNHGADAQVDYIVKNYPYIEGITTKFILGNHDTSFLVGDGVNIGKAISMQRPDMEYEGVFSATVNFGGLKIGLLHPDGGVPYARCFSDDTEILTEDGWKLFDDLHPGTFVATMNPVTHAFEWQLPTDYTCDDFDGELLNFKARCFDMLVTPDHRMYARRNPIMDTRKENLVMPTKSHPTVDYSWGFVTAEEMAKGNKQQWQMLSTSDDFVGIKMETVELPYVGVKPINDVLKLFGWYITEGCLSGKNKSEPNRVTISQSKKHEHHRQEIITTIENLGFIPRVYGDMKIAINNGLLAQYLESECGRGSYNVHIPKWIKELPKEKLQLLLTTMIKGDGWDSGNSWGYKSKSKQLIDDVQEIAIKCGYGANVSPSGDTVMIRSTQNYPTINKKPERVPYVGKVYCVSVPNQVILVRRKGKAIWSGNSYRLQKIIEQLAPENKPHILVMGHLHSNVTLPMYRNVYAIQIGCTEAQTPYLVRKGLYSEVGFGILEFSSDENGAIWHRYQWFPTYVTLKEDY